MSRQRLQWCVVLLAVPVPFWSCLAGMSGQSTDHLSQAGSPAASFTWSSPATLKSILGKKSGDLVIGSAGIEFRSEGGRSLSLRFLDIQTFSLSSHSLEIKTYQNRKNRLPGMQRYRFDFKIAVPAEVAASLAKEVERPSRNDIPDPGSLSDKTLPVHHQTRLGGTNGFLHFHESGIDYMSSATGDSRSWRWADLRTLSSPDPYHLYIFGYRDTYTFDLKETLSSTLFNHLTDEIEDHNLPELQQQPRRSGNE